MTTHRCAVVAGQSLLMLAMLVGMQQVPLQRLLPLAVTLVLASLLFLCLIFALVPPWPRWRSR
ncbi:MAG: hypothetical protein ACRC2B_19850 [Rubrivivax sp.]